MIDITALFKDMANSLDSLLIEVDDKLRRRDIQNSYILAVSSLAKALCSTDDDYSKKIGASLKDFQFEYHKHREVLVKYYHEIREDIPELLELAFELYGDSIDSDSIFLMPIDIYRSGVCVNDRETEDIKEHVTQVFGRGSVACYAPMATQCAKDPKPNYFGNAEWCQVESGMIIPLFLAKIMKISFRQYSMKDRMIVSLEEDTPSEPAEDDKPEKPRMKEAREDDFESLPDFRPDDYNSRLDER